MIYMLLPICSVKYNGGVMTQTFIFRVQSEKIHRAKLVSKEWYDLLSYLSDDALLDDNVICTFNVSLPLDIHNNGNIPTKVVDMIKIFIEQYYPHPDVCDHDDVALMKLIRYCASHSMYTYTSVTMNEMDMFHESLKYT